MTRIAKWHAVVLLPRAPSAIAEQRVDVAAVRADTAARRALRQVAKRLGRRHLHELRLTLVRSSSDGRATQLPLYG